MLEMSRSRDVYEAALEGVHLRAMRAALRASDDDPAIVAAIDRTLEATVGRLEALSSEGSDRMSELAARLGLEPAEVDLLWACVAATAEPRMLVHTHSLLGSDARRGMSLGLYALIADLDGTVSRRLALRLDSEHPLVACRLLEPADVAATPTARPLVAARRLAGYLAGEDAVDAKVAATGGLVTVPANVCYDDAQALSLERLAEGLAVPAPLLISVEGPYGVGRRTGVAAAAARAGRSTVAIDVKRLPASAAALEDALGSLLRECVLRGAVPVVAEIDDLIGSSPEGDARMRTLGRVVDAFPMTVVVTSNLRGIEVPTGRRLFRVDWPVADTAARRRLWRSYLGAAAVGLADELDGVALRYRLGAGGIARAADSAAIIARSSGQAGMTAHHVVAGVRNNIAERLGSLATRIEVKQRWEDLILSQDIMDQIQALIARVRRAHEVYEEWGFHRKAARGIGVPALFSGPPGTGKTMVAGIIARELDLELLQVDLSQVVSKWIGETEKQLSKVFDAAEAGHALLLFDEADSLFAKRTEVKGATDRYANLEVNYLLQRVEAFGGITVLTTNLETSIDMALKRRLAAHVVFWPPDEDEREALWKRLLDTGAAPLADDLNFAHLARSYPDMSGANIRNAVLSAAFLASSESTPISQAHLERAARGEYRTMGRILR
jgi:AAA+ superfamily predicted ATPase